MELVDFLRSRLDEDERLVADLTDEVETASHQFLGERMRREVEAKRAILDMHHPSGEYEPDACVLCQWDIDCDSPRHDYQDGAGEFPCPTLRILAAVYSSHPDYDAAWALEPAR